MKNNADKNRIDDKVSMNNSNLRQNEGDSKAALSYLSRIGSKGSQGAGNHPDALANNM